MGKKENEIILENLQSKLDKLIDQFQEINTKDDKAYDHLKQEWNETLKEYHKSCNLCGLVPDPLMKYL